MIVLSHIKRLMILTSLVALFGSISLGQEKQTIAILDFDGLGISQHEAQLLTNRLRTLLVQTDAYNVIERGQMEQILNEQNFQMAGCTSQECAVEVGQLLGAQVIMTGSIGKIGQTFTVDLRIINVETSEILRTASYDIRGEIDLMLTEGMVEVARRISGESQLGAGPRYGTLNIYSEPSGALVYINDEERGSTPFAATQLAAQQQHTVRIEKQGFQPVTRTIKIEEGENPALNVTLSSSYGGLSVSSQPSGASVIIDGQEVGTTPYLNQEIGAGREHEVQVTLEGYESVTRSVTVSEGATQSIDVTLSAATNFVTVTSRPDRAQVIIDDQRVGLTPLQELEYQIGMHSIELKKRGYKPHLAQFRVEQEEPTFLQIRLRSKSRGTAFLLSMFIPGAGHFYRAKPLGGLFFLGATAAAGYLVYDNYTQYTDYQDQYQTLLEEYNQTTDAQRGVQLRQEIDTIFDEMSTLTESQEMYIGVLGGVYGLNLLTVLF